jgi:hypothetical protein
MAQFSQFKSLVFAAGALLTISSSSTVMAQSAEANPGGTQGGSYSGHGTEGPAWPIYGSAQYGQYGASAGSGNGAGFVAAGTISPNGHYNIIGASTQAPGTVCSTLPGTDVPEDCDAW